MSPLIAVVAERGQIITAEIAIGTLEVDQRGKMVAQERQSIPRIEIMFTTLCIVLRSDQWPTTVHPFCDHGDAFASLLTRMSHLWTTIPSVASVWLLSTRSILHGDHGVYGEAWTSCVSVLNNQCKFRPQFCLQWRTDHLYDHKMETQTYQSLCIGDFNKIYHINPPIQGTIYVCPLFYINSESIDYLMISQTCICSTSRTSSST